MIMIVATAIHKHNHNNNNDNNRQLKNDKFVYKKDSNGCRKGTNGVSTNGLTANLMFLLTEGPSWLLPLNLLLSSQKCQGVPFSPIRRN